MNGTKHCNVQYAKIEMHTMYSSATSYYVVVASILSYTQLRTQRVEIVYAREYFDASIARNVKCYEVRIKTEVTKEATVNFLHILGQEHVFYHNFIEIELSPTIFKL